LFSVFFKPVTANDVVLRVRLAVATLYRWIMATLIVAQLTVQEFRTARKRSHDEPVTIRDLSFGYRVDDTETDPVYRPRPPNKLVEIDMGPVLGRGGYGIVYASAQFPTRIAIKVLERDEKATRECMLTRKVGSQGHPNVVVYIKNLLIPRGHTVRYLADHMLRNGHLLYIGYCGGGTLQDMLSASKDGTLAETVVVELARQMMRALSFCHENNVLHCDIKPANIMLDTSTNNWRLCDFSCARHIGAVNYVEIDHKRQEAVCAPVVRAPEALMEELAAMDPSPFSEARARGFRCGRPVDVWAMGVCLVRCVSGTYPFQSRDMGRPGETDAYSTSKELTDPTRLATTQRDMLELLLRSIVLRLGRPLLGTYPEADSLLAELPRDAPNEQLYNFWTPLQLADPVFASVLKSIFVFNPCNRVTAATACKMLSSGTA
jgi:serine/threonine protein kinase